MSATAFATHNRAGEITYLHRPDLGPFVYEIQIQTCTKTSSPADRPWLHIRYGDEGPNTTEAQLDSLQRSSITLVPDQDAQINIYKGFHNYSGPGIYELYVIDPNRNSNILNIPSSVNVPFTIKTVLVISVATGHNNSVQLLNPPKERACLNQPWVHNPGAYDPDGDSLVFSLVPCLGQTTDDINSLAIYPIQGWVLPNIYTSTFPNDTFTINSQTGDVFWLNPPLAGEYNIAILISEYRNGIFVGSVLRDMQIDVILCPNVAPQIQDMPDYCVEAGETLEIPVIVTDADNDNVTVTAFGGPLSEVANEASFSSVDQLFQWTPQCEEVRAQPYLVTFEAQDDGNIPLSDLETVQIQVVAPRVENPDALAFGNSITLNWDANPCAPIFSENEATHVVYKVYRRSGEYGFVPDNCELGVPGYTGYVEVGQSQGLNNTTYVDTDVQYGGIYCYMIATCWPDGAISYASEEFCDTVKKDVPVMTKVSVGITDLTAGVDTIWWSAPTDMDTTIYPGPFRYKLYHATGNNAPNELIYEGDEFQFLTWGDTTFVHENINTFSEQHRYRVAIFSNGDSVNVSSAASSVFLTVTPGDNSMLLTMNESIPWTNTEYQVFRKDPGGTQFNFITNTSENPYRDTALVNNREYCYKVFCKGTYNASFILDPLWNYTQETCATPYDQEPPCPPTLLVDGSCDDQISTLDWTNPNNSCADDVTAYNIYYAPTSDAPLTLLASYSDSNDTIYIFNQDNVFNSIAGCFAVTALDSLNLWPDGALHQNESAFSNIVCVDNCPLYFLPNIFSPNADGANDFLVPIAQRFVKDIHLQIYNRWGSLLFETTDRDIKWNGTDGGGDLVSDGTYYYVITVNTIRLEGIVEEKFAGYIQIINSIKSSNPE